MCGFSASRTKSVAWRCRRRGRSAVGGRRRRGGYLVADGSAVEGDEGIQPVGSKRWGGEPDPATGGGGGQDLLVAGGGGVVALVDDDQPVPFEHGTAVGAPTQRLQQRDVDD